MHLAAQLLSRTAVRVIMYVRAYACILCMHVHMRVHYRRGLFLQLNCSTAITNCCQYCIFEKTAGVHNSLGKLHTIHTISHKHSIGRRGRTCCGGCTRPQERRDLSTCVRECHIHTHVHTPAHTHTHTHTHTYTHTHTHTHTHTCTHAHTHTLISLYSSVCPTQQTQ